MTKSIKLTEAEFLILPKDVQNTLVAQHVFNWVKFEWEEEGSGFTPMPNQYWCPGSGAYFYPIEVWASSELKDKEESDVLDWLEAFGSTNFVEDLGAAIKILPQIVQYLPRLEAKKLWWEFGLLINGLPIVRRIKEPDKLPIGICLMALMAVNQIQVPQLACLSSSVPPRQS